MTQEYVTCLVCGGTYGRLSSHLRVHGIDTFEYEKRFPGAPTSSEKSLRMISDTLKGHEYSEEVRRKISESNLELWKDPKYGQRMANLTKEAMKDPKIRHKMSKALTERWRDPDLRRLQSEEKKRLWADPEYRKKHTEITRAFTNTPEYRQVQSEAATKRWSDPDYRRKMSEAVRKARHKVSEANRERWSDPEYREQTSRAISVGMKEAMRDPCLRRRISETLKERYKDPEFAQMVSKASHRRPNEPELKMQEVLNKHFPGEWKYVGDGAFWIEGRNPDFMNVNGKKAVIEIFGYWWHPEEDVMNRIEHYAKYGFDCLIFWEYDPWTDEGEIVQKVEEIRCSAQC